MPEDLGLKLKAPARKFQSRKSNLRANSSRKNLSFPAFRLTVFARGKKNTSPPGRAFWEKRSSPKE
jgi:hypothetical protein